MELRKRGEDPVDHPNNFPERPIFVVPLIKKSRAASIEYWSIIFTDAAVYFLRFNSNYVPGALLGGTVADAIYSNSSRSKLSALFSQGLNNVLQNTELYYRLVPNEFDSIEIERGPCRFKVILTFGTRKVLVLRVWEKYYSGFVQLLNRETRYDYIMLAASLAFLVCGTLLILFGVGKGIIFVGVAVLLAICNTAYRAIERKRSVGRGGK